MFIILTFILVLAGVLVLGGVISFIYETLTDPNRPGKRIKNQNTLIKNLQSNLKEKNNLIGKLQRENARLDNLVKSYSIIDEWDREQEELALARYQLEQELIKEMNKEEN